MLRRHMNAVGIVLLIVTLTLCNTGLTARAASGPDAPVADDTETAETKEARDVAAEYQVENITRQAQGAEPQTTTSSSGGKTLLYGGIAAAAVVGAVALAAGSGGGGGSSAEVAEEPEEPKLKPVGADLDGDNWHGRLILVDSGFKEDVTATVKQNGADIEITTSSTQKYGKKFIGHIDRNAFIQVRDQDTGEDWTTMNNDTRWNMIDLYDYVHSFRDLDRLYLTRESRQ